MVHQTSNAKDVVTAKLKSTGKNCYYKIINGGNGEGKFKFIKSEFAWRG